MTIFRILGLAAFIFGATSTIQLNAQNDVKVEVPANITKTSVDVNTDKPTLGIKTASPEIDATKEVPEKKEEPKNTVSGKLIQSMIFSLLGGLGIFLLGMRYMSDGLQKIAGNSLKKLIRAVTDNRFMACGVGVMVTLLVQSSSVTTVMAVGFVNSTIMELNQAIGIILGANIGTTVTGWVLFLKIGKWGLPILGIAAFTFLFSRKEKVKFLAMAVMGIGMIFFGLELMKNGFKPIKEIPAFEAAFTQFDASTYFGILKCAFVGCILTVIVQSSSATLGITIALASTGAIPFETAAALVLGENIGTTITAFLASLGSSSNAKKAAYFHIFFNVVGVIWITALFGPYIDLIEYIMSNFMGVTDINAVKIIDGKESFIYVTGAIAMVHSVFNVTNVLLFLPFTGVAAKILDKFVAREKGEGQYLTHLDFQIYDTAFAAIEQSSFEITKMNDKTKEMFTFLEQSLQKCKKKTSEKVFESEQILDVVQTEITQFLTDVLAGSLSQEQAEEAKQQLLLADEYESISDYIMQLVKFLLRLEENGMALSDEQKTEIAELHGLVVKLYDKVHTADTDLTQLFTESTAQSDSLKIHIKKLRAKHWDRISNEKMPPLLSTSYADIINAYRKINNLIVHVIETKTNKRNS
jgi:phosphate:Na+ symporter